MDPRVQSLVALFQNLRPDKLDELAARYAESASFKDPFNDVRGRASIRAVYAHMFEQLQAPRFEVLDVLVDGDRCFLAWDFIFQRKGGSTGGSASMRIHGSSLMRLDAEGRVLSHRDYWDVAEELYEKLPLLGSLMRWLKRRLGTPTEGR